MCCMDPASAEKTMAPRLSTQQRQKYVAEEVAFVEDLLEDTDDCKWIYQSLIDLTLLRATLGGQSLDSSQKKDLQLWLNKLRALDPLRKGRWDDLARSCDIQVE
jgi:geranylgeranyl transferase type-2 subunit alpha